MIRLTMGVKLGYILVFVLFAVGMIFAVRYIINTRIPNEGILKIQSTPPSSIFLDNVHKGRTPFEGKVPSGEYTIKLVADSPTGDFAPWQGKIVVSQNLLTYVNRDLSGLEISSAGEVLWLERISSDKSEMSITSTPDGATAIVDDETKGITPLTLTQIEPGDHTLIVSSAGFLSRTLKLRTTAGYKLNVSVQLALSPGRGDQLSPLESTNSAELNPTASPSATPVQTKTATDSARIPDPKKPFVLIGETSIGFLRVRKEPTIASEELSRVEPGDKYTILDSKSGWYNISYDGTNTGWVSGQYVEVIEE